MVDTSEETALPGGLVLRPATADDAAQLPDLNAEVHGENERHPVAVVLGLAGPPAPAALLADDDVPPLTDGPTDWLVVVDGERVVSTCALFRHHLRVGPVTLPVAQVEWVGTLEPYRRRGLVRAMVERHHQRARQRDDLLSVISGIPHYYRRFGYGYAIDWPARFQLPERVDGAGDGTAVREATPEDLDVLVARTAAAQAHHGVAMRRDRRTWWNLLHEGPRWHDTMLVAERGGQVVGSARYLHARAETTTEVQEGSADDLAAATALVAEVRARSGAKPATVTDRIGSAWSPAVHQLGQPAGRWHPTYVRSFDAVALLDALRPALSGRLARSPLANERGELVLSLYTSAVRLTYERGEVVGVEAAPGIEDPEDTDDAAVAPDALPALVLGRFGAEGLARRQDDVLLGRHRQLLSVLFPRLVADQLFPA